MIRFLIDECLTPKLLTVARDRGYEARHIIVEGKRSLSDPVIAAEARMADDIFVTNNARHFRRLYAKFTSHPGLVILLPSVPLAEQIRLFDEVILFIESEGSVVDQMVTVRRDGTIAVEPWPRTV